MTESPKIAAFGRAAAVLGFSFEPRLPVRLDGDRSIHSLGLVRDFGATNGTLVFAESEAPETSAVAELKNLGYFVSVLFDSYNVFDEEHFKATLNDWGFYGQQSDRPRWFTGVQWDHSNA